LPLALLLIWPLLVLYAFSQILTFDLAGNEPNYFLNTFNVSIEPQQLAGMANHSVCEGGSVFLIPQENFDQRSPLVLKTREKN
jgi:hypothetical protein